MNNHELAKALRDAADFIDTLPANCVLGVQDSFESHCIEIQLSESMWPDQLEATFRRKNRQIWEYVSQVAPHVMIVALFDEARP